MDKQQKRDLERKQLVKRVVISVLISVAMLATLAFPVSAAPWTWGFGTNVSAINPNIIDYPNLSLLIGNMAGIFPGIVTLVVGVLPILITLAIISVIFGILGAVVAMIGGLAHGLFR